MTIKVKAPGSCGELVQGTIDGVNFLITCPIDWYSEVEVVPESSSGELKPKTVAAVRETLKYLGISKTINLKIHSDLPYGKGMASSSADVSAACQATALAVADRRLSPDEITDIALAIEPTDGIFYPEIIMIDHLKGTLRRLLGTPPPMRVAIFDVASRTNAIIDTLDFNSRKDLPQLNADKEKETRLAAEMVIRGLAEQNSRYIADGATLSALANQKILYKPYLEEIIATAKLYGALGVCAAHSGTVLGVLFDQDGIEGYAGAVESICRIGKEIQYLKTARIIAGGLKEVL